MRCGAKAVLLEAVDDAESLQLIIWAAQGYRGQLEDSVFIVCGCKLEIVKRNEPGFKILPRKWVVERNFAWLGNNRNLRFTSPKTRRSAPAYLERKLTAHRKSLHGKLVHEILSLGNTIKLEKHFNKAFQKLFGKSVGLRATGEFVSRLKCLAQSAGVTVVEFSTFKTKLSQRKLI
ncbi:hypothetical protein [Microseira wollei]|uniref:IS5 family transposase n=1 Tax=Microseira wollei NIES-4236 TaxID=2530354 RepID=A0AAV3XMA3_9CYAN|nr:IS5 family transposase [Microseira wollei NIES-4236]